MDNVKKVNNYIDILNSNRSIRLLYIVNYKLRVSVKQQLYVRQIKVTCFASDVGHHQTYLYKCIREVYILVFTNFSCIYEWPTRTFIVYKM
jgi:hypothetical protein